MKTLPKKLRPIPQFLLWGVGLLLLYLAFRSQPLDEVAGALKTADWRWPILIFAISIANHWIRVLRWKMLLQPLGHQPSSVAGFMSLMFGYMVNMAVPRLGEISRCLTLERVEKVPFRPSFGTVIMERIIDVFCLALVIAMAILLESEQLYAFFMKEVYPPINDLFREKSFAVRVVGISGVLLCSLALAYILAQWHRLKRRAWGRLLWRFLRQLWKGVVSIQQLPSAWLFIAYSLFIWCTYFLMTYLWFFCFEETEMLSWKTGLVMLSISSIARSLPIQGGGIGAYHYLFAQGMLLYGVDTLYGASLALMVHGLQSIYYLLSGLLATLWIGWKSKGAPA